MDMTPTDSEIIAAYKRLDNQIATARELGCSQSHVSTVLRRNNIRIGRGGKQRKFVEQDFLDLWNQYHDTAEVADRIGTSRSYVTQVLWDKFGIRCPKVHPNKIPLPMERIKRRYLAGESCAQIAQDFGLPAERIRRRLRSYGVPRRTLKQSVPRGRRNRFYKNGKGKREVMHYYRRQAYEVAAICLGQPVPKGWIIHHVNANPRDNRPENLLLFESQGEHAAYHILLIDLRQTDPQVDSIRVALENGAQALPSPPHPIELEPCTDPPDPFGSQDQPEPLQQLSLLMS